MVIQLKGYSGFVFHRPYPHMACECDRGMDPEQEEVHFQQIKLNAESSPNQRQQVT